MPKMTAGDGSFRGLFRWRALVMGYRGFACWDVSDLALFDAGK